MFIHVPLAKEDTERIKEERGVMGNCLEARSKLDNSVLNSGNFSVNYSCLSYYIFTCNASTWSSLLFILLCGFSQLPQWFSCRSHKSSQYKWSIFCSFEYVSSCALSKIWRWHFVIKKQLGCFQRKHQEFKSSNLNWPRSGMLDSLQRKK